MKEVVQEGHDDAEASPLSRAAREVLAEVGVERWMFEGFQLEEWLQGRYSRRQLEAILDNSEVPVGYFVETLPTLKQAFAEAARIGGENLDLNWILRKLAVEVLHREIDRHVEAALRPRQ